MDVLWAPWRMAYIGAAKEEGGCLFCAALAGDARERLVLGTTPHGLVMLNRYPYQNGHLMVAPRWAGDTNFMPVVGDVRVMPEHLLATYDRLKPAFDWLA